MGWAAAFIFWALGCHLAADVYLDNIEAQDMVVETTPSKLAFVLTVACWPLIELYNLVFKRGEYTHGE